MLSEEKFPAGCVSIATFRCEAFLSFAGPLLLPFNANSIKQDSLCVASSFESQSVYICTANIFALAYTSYRKQRLAIWRVRIDCPEFVSTSSIVISALTDTVLGGSAPRQCTSRIRYSTMGGCSGLEGLGGPECTSYLQVSPVSLNTGVQRGS